ncbi:MAG: hypothetical protein WCG83_06600 [Candidatus Peregrinibacteria bacterium]
MELTPYSTETTQIMQLRFGEEQTRAALELMESTARGTFPVDTEPVLKVVGIGTTRFSNLIWEIAANVQVERSTVHSSEDRGAGGTCLRSATPGSLQGM